MQGKDRESENRGKREIREAEISKEYNINEIGTKILNGDGAGWIKEVARRQPYENSKS
ncbi:hypothetical protein GOQ29_12630 [Clostridium sp. D2Q-14]|uniref:hypothetical protein n=1 Tax=Anaeromonas gelatinilytica TaxID=2683194 RepID=UPI00193B4ACE|nr:hypothetical protein [Anaeromonas gelatinilytica]MBS4536465.1 hypothetical protein [Anaeromonas gelatinilytica]